MCRRNQIACECEVFIMDSWHFACAFTQMSFLFYGIQQYHAFVWRGYYPNLRKALPVNPHNCFIRYFLCCFNNWYFTGSPRYPHFLCPSVSFNRGHYGNVKCAEGRGYELILYWYNNNFFRSLAQFEPVVFFEKIGSFTILKKGG